MVDRLSRFYRAVNERSEFLSGYRNSYDPPDEALGIEVEYFHPVITYDDRMRYICEHIVTNPRMSSRNRVCNTIISHFYGARGIHQVLTSVTDPDEAFVDFELLAKEQRWGSGAISLPGEYTDWLRKNCVAQKERGLPFWGTTELHSSLQGAARKFVNELYDTDDKGTPANLAEWIASLINKGVIDEMLSVSSLRELYGVFMSLKGVGEYYGYHGAASSSNNPEIRAYHDERFCAPGPGARDTATKMFPGLSVKSASLEDRIIWFREKQSELMDIPTIHRDRWNIQVGRVAIYPEPQNELKTYGTEVCMCQFAVYERLRINPHLIGHRKVARVERGTSLDDFFDS